MPAKWAHGVGGCICVGMRKIRKTEMLGNAGNNLKMKAEEDSGKEMCVCVRVCVCVCVCWGWGILS